MAVLPRKGVSASAVALTRDMYAKYNDTGYFYDKEFYARERTAKLYATICYRYGKTFRISKEIRVAPDYIPVVHRNTSRGFVIKFNLIVCGKDLGPITGVVIDGNEVLFCNDVMDIHFIAPMYSIRRENDEDTGIQDTEGDLALDEEEMPESEMQGLQGVRGEAHNGMSSMEGQL